MISFSKYDDSRTVEVTANQNEDWKSLAEMFYGFLVASGYSVTRDDLSKLWADPKAPFDDTIYSWANTVTYPPKDASISIVSNYSMPCECGEDSCINWAPDGDKYDSEK